jgi:prepilin-type N-terminal cleavage/methylation domain-containing protein/prepilin-type processing-associated H-X9-DG protein
MKWSGMDDTIYQCSRPDQTGTRKAFTLVELLVVIVIIAILASLILPALSRAKAKAQTTQCRSNLQQLQLGWLLYVDQNNDRLPPNNTTGAMTGATGSWVLGSAAEDRTATNIESGVLYPFTQNAAIYHCPADKSNVNGHKGLPRYRSYSLNWYLGVDPNVHYSPRIKLRASGITNPLLVFAFIDEDAATIDDGTFFSPEEYGQWGDLPAIRHALQSTLSFADGHVELWKWAWPKKKPGPTANQADKDDLERLWRASP